MKKILLTLVIFQAIISNDAFSQASIVLKADGGPGFSFNGGGTLAGYPNSIEVYSFSDGLQGCITLSRNCLTTGSGLQLVIPLSHAVTDFKSIMLQGKNLLASDMIMLKPSGSSTLTEFFRIHMEDVRVTSVQEGASGESPFVNLQLQPSRIAWQVITISNTGTQVKSSYGWDFTKAIPFNYVF